MTAALFSQTSSVWPTTARAPAPTIPAADGTPAPTPGATARAPKPTKHLAKATAFTVAVAVSPDGTRVARAAAKGAIQLDGPGAATPQLATPPGDAPLLAPGRSQLAFARDGRGLYLVRGGKAWRWTLGASSCQD